MRKGQTAMEYLMTYGWAILIILIVGGLLVYYGVFSIRPGRAIQGFGDIQVGSTWNLLPNGNLQMTMQNRVTGAINITAIYAGTSSPSQAGTVTPTLPLTIPSGQTSSLITASFSGLGGATTGDPYLVYVAIQYTVLSSGQQLNSTGTLGGTRG